jgi:hypothetical protein
MEVGARFELAEQFPVRHFSKVLGAPIPALPLIAGESVEDGDLSQRLAAKMSSRVPAHGAGALGEIIRILDQMIHVIFTGQRVRGPD